MSSFLSDALEKPVFKTSPLFFSRFYGMWISLRQADKKELRLSSYFLQSISFLVQFYLPMLNNIWFTLNQLKNFTGQIQKSFWTIQLTLPLLEVELLAQVWPITLQNRFADLQFHLELRYSCIWLKQVLHHVHFLACIFIMKLICVESNTSIA